jgi:moderate conductance mechanosensitive channel
VLALPPIPDVTNWGRTSGLQIIFIITGSILLARFVRWLGSRLTDRIDRNTPDRPDIVRSEAAKHGHVVVQVTMWSVIVIIYCAAAILTLQRLSVPITGLVAPAAVVGVALGFGAQRLVQDILAGFFIIAERQYGYGDMVRISALGSETGIGGTVEQVSLRTTRLRTLTGDVVIVPNGQIVQVTNQSRDWARAVIDVPVPTSTDVGKVREILTKVGEKAGDDKELGPLLLDAPTVVGVESMDVDTLRLRIVARTLPGKQFQVGRELRARVAQAFLADGITVATSLDTAEPVAAK